MFWKREEKTPVGKWPMPLIPPPPKKQFQTMLEMLKDAEKYDNNDEKEVCESVLTGLCEYIERFKSGKL